MFQTKLADKTCYKSNIGRKRLRLAQLQKLGKETQKIKIKNLSGYEKIDGILNTKAYFLCQNLS